MMAFLAPLLPYGIALAALLGLWGAHKAEVALQHHAGYVEGKGEVQTAWDADKAKKAAAIAALASAWDAQRQRADDASRQRDEATRARFAALEDQAVHLPAADARLRIPASALSVLDGAVDAANAAGPPAEPAGSAARPAQSASGAARWADSAVAGTAGTEDSNVAMITTWGVGAARLYRTCRDRVDALITFYDSLRRSQPENAQ